jgi:hypothetical protein
MFLEFDMYVKGTVAQLVRSASSQATTTPDLSGQGLA